MFRGRMYTALRALVFGDDFTSDPVSTILGYGLRYFSRGTLAINVQLVSQVRLNAIIEVLVCKQPLCLA